MFKPLSQDHPLAKTLGIEERVAAEAERLLKEHGLWDQGWRYRSSTTLRFVGYCYYYRKIIEVSEHYLLKTDWKEIVDVILHEIAHALAFLEYGEEGKGHGWYWKHTARRIGANPSSTTHKAVSTAKPNYKMECPNCGRVWWRYRMRRRNFGSKCPDCKVAVTIYKITRKGA